MRPSRQPTVPIEVQNCRLDGQELDVGHAQIRFPIGKMQATNRASGQDEFSSLMNAGKAAVRYRIRKHTAA